MSSGNTGKVVSLRKARKHMQRAAAERTATANRLAHGRSKSERMLEESRENRRLRDLNGHRIDGGDRK